MPMESFSSSSSLLRPIHVYLSFKGGNETCKFTDRLWAALETDDLNTFFDDKKLDPCDSTFLPRHFLKAIQQSNIFMIVFSKNYASSVWCLEELSEIAERIHELRSIVIPIFYDVDPSEVQNQSNSFEKAFAEHEHRFTTNLLKVHSWRSAMRRVANLSGWNVPHDPCPDVIDDIVREVKKKVRHQLFYVDADLVGIRSRVREVEELLDLGPHKEVRVVGICGMGGIGKTTLARVVYDRISHRFDASYFLLNLSEFHMSKGMVHGKNILLVLDNLVSYQNLKPLIQTIDDSLLGGGSRIIITTTDEGVLEEFEKYDAYIYRVKLLSREEALQLFRRKAFRYDFPVRGYDEEVINRALEYASGLPLAIVKLGSFLYNTRSSEWSTALVEFKKVASFVVMKVLKRSFRELDTLCREVFLDIACFFSGKEITFVEEILDACKPISEKSGVQVLIRKSLMAIIDKKVQMHGLLQEMGKEIVRKKSPSKPEKWSRLWNFDDIYAVMQNHTEYPNVEAIVLDLEDDSPGKILRVEALSRMMNLRLLIFHNVKFSGALRFLSWTLRYISWHQYPFTSLPFGFIPSKLKELILPDSCITSIWGEEQLTLEEIDFLLEYWGEFNRSEDWSNMKAFPYLRNMNLSGSKDLTDMPNFKTLPRLERLDLEGCIKLSHLHPSIADCSRIEYLNLRTCTSLVSIPNTLFSLPSLEILNLACCSKLATCLNFHPFEEELGENPNMKIIFSDEIRSYI